MVTQDPISRNTPLHEEHIALGARMVPFAGFQMPIQYTGIIAEHMAVREKAGLFDVSHMGEVLVSGSRSFEFVQKLVTNDVSKLTDGKALYTVMCNEDAGIVDDLLVYRLSADRYLLVINASNIGTDFAWMQEHNVAEAALENISSEIALIAIQGPESIAILQGLTDLALEDIGFYNFAVPEPGSFLGCRRAILSRTGYTGEAGFEIYCEAEKATDVWNALLEAGESRGLIPAGLGCRDTLRLEAGYCLYGNDITLETNPYEAGLAWLVKPDAGPFIGSERLAEIKADGPRRRLAGFSMEDRGIPRAGHEIVSSAGQTIGTVTSGSQSPVRACGIGMGYVPNDPIYTEPGAVIGISSRGRVLSARIEKPPFHKN